MIGLTDTDLAGIRGEAALMLTQECTVRRRTNGVWTTVAECVPCLLQRRQGREELRGSDPAVQIDADVVLLTRVGVDIRVLDRVRVEGRILEVRYQAPRPVAHSRWLGKLDSKETTA